MKTKTMTKEELTPLSVASLPTNPTAEKRGEKRYTPEELKAAFDRLPLYVAKRLNSLIDEIEGESFAFSVKLGEEDLGSFYLDTLSGRILDRIPILDTTLTEFLLSMRRDIDTLMKGGETGEKADV